MESSRGILLIFLILFSFFFLFYVGFYFSGPLLYFNRVNGSTLKWNASLSIEAVDVDLNTLFIYFIYLFIYFLSIYESISPVE